MEESRHPLGPRRGEITRPPRLDMDRTGKPNQPDKPLPLYLTAQQTDRLQQLLEHSDTLVGVGKMFSPNSQLRETANFGEQQRWLRLNETLDRLNRVEDRTLSESALARGLRWQREALEKHSKEAKILTGILTAGAIMYTGYEIGQTAHSAQLVAEKVGNLIGSAGFDLSLLRLDALVPQIFPPRGPDFSTAFNSIGSVLDAHNKQMASALQAVGNQLGSVKDHAIRTAIGTAVSAIGIAGRPLDRIKSAKGAIGKMLTPTAGAAYYAEKGARSITRQTRKTLRG